MKKIIFYLIIALFLFIPSNANADDDINQIIEQELSLFDFSSWNYTDGDINIDAEKMIADISKGENAPNLNKLSDYIISVIKGSFLSSIPLLLILIVCGAASGMCVALLPDNNSKLSELVNFIATAMCISVLVAVICNSITAAISLIDKMNRFSEIASPIISLVMIASGKSSTNAVFSPAMAFLSNGITVCIKSVIIPLVIIGFVLCFSAALTGKNKLDKFFSLLKSTLKWLCGGITTFFLGAVTIYGLGAKAHDNLLLKTTKYVLDKSLPVAGGLISGTADTILECFNTIKTVSGVVFIIILLLITFKTLINIIALIFTLKIAAALCEPISNHTVIKLITDVSDNMNYLLGAVAITDVMFIITTALCTCFFV